MSEFLQDGPADAKVRLILAHGAGAPMDTPFMNAFAAGLGGRGVHVVRFEFPYMHRRRTDAKTRPPDRMPRLLESFRAAIDAWPSRALWIGGKSMGGRVAATLAANVASTPIRGVVCLGYPFHPPGKPDRLRLEPLQGREHPVLVCQGTRDPFGKRDEIESYDLAPNVKVVYVEGGDHSLVPLKSSGRTSQDAWGEGVATVASFLLDGGADNDRAVRGS